MERLNDTTLPKFLNATGVAVVLVGAADGPATLEQAWEFCALWVETRTNGLNDIRFGYVDGDACPTARPLLGVTRRPTTLVIRSRRMADCFEGVIDRQAIVSALLPAPWRARQIARHLLPEVRHDEVA